MLRRLSKTKTTNFKTGFNLKENYSIDAHFPPRWSRAPSSFQRSRFLKVCTRQSYLMSRLYEKIFIGGWLSCCQQRNMFIPDVQIHENEKRVRSKYLVYYAPDTYFVWNVCTWSCTFEILIVSCTSSGFSHKSYIFKQYLEEIFSLGSFLQV